MSLFRDAYSRPLLQALLWQLGLLCFFGVFVLDAGVRFKASILGSAGFWFGVLLILIRRPKNPTRADLAYIRWGLPIIVALTIPIILAWWRANRRI